MTEIPWTSKAGILIPIFVFALFAPVATANVCGEEDRVMLQEGVVVDTPGVTLSAKSVDTLMRAIHSVRKGTLNPCTGIAISPRQVLLAHHCFKADEAVARQRHFASNPAAVNVRKLLRSDQEMIDWLKATYKSRPEFVNRPDELAAQMRQLEEIERHPQQLLSRLVDFAVFERTEGEFESFVSPDPTFDFSQISESDRFAVVGLPILGDGIVPSLGQAKIWLSPVTSLRYDDPGSFGQRGKSEVKRAKKKNYPKLWDREKRDHRPPEPNAKSLVSFCADVFKGNSGSPLIRFREEDGQLAMSVVAVVSQSIPKPVATDFPNVAGTPLSFVWVREYLKERTSVCP